MKAFKFNIPIIILILCELAIGIFLLSAPEHFTEVLIIVFGIVALLIGIIYVIRFFRARKQGAGDMPALIIGIVSLFVGFGFTVFTHTMVGFVAAIAVLYGIIMIITGVFKISEFSVHARQDCTARSFRS
ncbi:MAG: DUF308 domain-containing protein [Ruminiclostridium sp.]|nr:DUF308 domain-containing protein [Ruminiclostridium sp.]